jgi:hypothetical protein
VPGGAPETRCGNGLSGKNYRKSKDFAQRAKIPGRRVFMIDIYNQKFDIQIEKTKSKSNHPTKNKKVSQNPVPKKTNPNYPFEKLPSNPRMKNQSKS